ncbi:MAG: hypothetical protein ABJD07_12305 [Gemmatimonadaceae bacterium]
MRRLGSASGQRRLEDLYAKRGFAALFVSRFLPGVRALVPPFAGAWIFVRWRRRRRP